jgi:hypothetical protein
MTKRYYTPGHTFRDPYLSALRAEYAALLHDAGLCNSGIAQALGFTRRKRERARRIVALGQQRRTERAVKEIAGTVTGDILDSLAYTGADLQFYIDAKCEEFMDKLKVEYDADSHS